LKTEIFPNQLKFEGAPIFFSEHTTNRLGFEVQKTGFTEIFNMLISYFDLLMMYSFAKGKLSFPNLRKVKTASISGEKLIEKKRDLLRLEGYLSGKI